MTTVYTCENNLCSMMTCIYTAWASKKGSENIRLEIEPVSQYRLFEEYIHVDSDEAKAESVIKAINLKISPQFYHDIAYCTGAYEPDMLNTVYHVIILGFAYGPGVMDMYQYRDITRFREIKTRFGRESGHFIEFLRFHQVSSSVYVAHIEPKSHVIVPLAEYFSDRMPSEHWMIIDDVHKEAIVHPSNSPYYIRYLTPEEFEQLLSTEDSNDDYTSYWKAYFTHIAIKERNNPKCQLNLFPQWMRKHCVEFDKL